MDPIVSRWRRDGSGERVVRGDRPVLEIVAVQRKDNREWALPGVSGFQLKQWAGLPLCW